MHLEVTFFSEHSIAGLARPLTDELAAKLGSARFLEGFELKMLTLVLLNSF